MPSDRKRGKDKMPRKGHPLNPAREPATPMEKLDDSPSRVLRARLVELICSGAPVSEAASVLGVPSSTAYLWMQRPEIRSEVDRIQAEAIESARTILRSGASRAARRLMAISAGEIEDASHAEVKAATEVLDRVGVSAKQIVDLTVSGRIDTLSDDDLDRLIAEKLSALGKQG